MGVKEEEVVSVYEDDYYVPSGAKGYAQMMARSKERRRFDYLMECFRKEREKEEKGDRDGK